METISASTKRHLLTVSQCLQRLCCRSACTNRSRDGKSLVATTVIVLLALVQTLRHTTDQLLQAVVYFAILLFAIALQQLLCRLCELCSADLLTHSDCSQLARSRRSQAHTVTIELANTSCHNYLRGRAAPPSSPRTPRAASVRPRRGRSPRAAPAAWRWSG